MSIKLDRFVSQEINVICATCGEGLNINNRYESDIFRLIEDELYLFCPKCNHNYDIPYKKGTVEDFK